MTLFNNDGDTLWTATDYLSYRKEIQCQSIYLCFDGWLVNVYFVCKCDEYLRIFDHRETFNYTQKYFILK